MPPLTIVVGVVAAPGYASFYADAHASRDPPKASAIAIAPRRAGGGFLTTRGNSSTFDGVFWLVQVRMAAPAVAFTKARAQDSPEIQLSAPVK
jgi:hypothetical protein